MKSYNDYMNSISVDAELHERIMKKAGSVGHKSKCSDFEADFLADKADFHSKTTGISRKYDEAPAKNPPKDGHLGLVFDAPTQKPAPLYRRRTVYRYAGLAACAAVLALCVWTIPGLWNNPAENLPNNPVHISTHAPQPQNGGQNAIVTDAPPDSDTMIPGLRDEEFPLALNKAEALMQAGRLWPEGFFYKPLSEEQLSAVFPNLNLTLAATAFYSPDGTLLSVTATETHTPGRADAPIMVYEYFNRTEIQLGEGEIIEDCVMLIDGTPIISDVFGVPVTAYMSQLDNGPVYFQAEFVIDNIAYRVKLYDNIIAGELRLTGIVNDIIYYGAADLNVLSDPAIPELRNDRLTLEEAQGDPDFGLYLPQTVPSRFVFESAHRFINQDANGMYVLWTADLGNLWWNISKATDHGFERIVSADEREKYDMSLYSIPWAQSVPNELREYVLYPVLPAEELTLEIIKARVYYRDTTSGGNMDFSVLYGEAIISVNINGMSPEEVWEMFTGLDN